MPLHLLGKKSWNVYNRDNIARVRRDEEEAIAREVAAEQMFQDASSCRRITSLRGGTQDDDTILSHEDLRGPEFSSGNISQDPRRGFAHGDRDHRRKRRRGEDDTDRDIRYVMRAADEHVSHRVKLVPKLRNGRKVDHAPIMDKNGNINLFDMEGHIDNDTIRTRSSGRGDDIHAIRPGFSKGSEGIVRLTDARGHQRQTEQRAWQRPPRKAGENLIQRAAADAIPECSVDLKRLQRTRIQRAADDPLVAMNRGVQQVRKIESDRRTWKEKRLAETDIMSSGKHQTSSRTCHYHKA